MLTLFHHSLPPWAGEYGGWKLEKTVDYFMDFTRLAFYLVVDYPVCCTLQFILFSSFLLLNETLDHSDSLLSSFKKKEHEQEQKQTKSTLAQITFL